MQDKKSFDLIFSIGGSCASASQLKNRGFRFTSLPFDWLTTFNPNDTLTGLIKCFKDDFTNFLKQKNLVELTEDEKGDDNRGHIQCKDLVTQYHIIHCFKKHFNDKKEYARVKAIFDRRIKKLYNLLDKSNSVCILFDVNKNVNMDLVKELTEIIKEKFHINYIEFHTIKFKSDEIEETEFVHATKRDRNLYDFSETNFIWAFLDNFAINKKKDKILSLGNIQILKVNKIKGGFSFSFFPKFAAIIRAKLSILGFACLDVSIGKIKI